MLLTRYGHQKKLNPPTVRRRQFLLGCSVFRRSMRTGQKYMREMMCCAGPSARALMLLALSFGAITSSVALTPPNGQAGSGGVSYTNWGWFPIQYVS